MCSNIKDFKNSTIKQPMNFDSDHGMLVATLLLQSESKHRKFVKIKTTFPLPIFLETTARSEKLFKDIYEANSKTEKVQIDTMDLISDNTYKLFKMKSMSRRSKNTTRTKKLGKLVRKSLNNDRKLRVEKVASEAESYLKTNQIHEAYQYIQNWYKPKKSTTTNPSDKEIDIIQKEYQKLYTAITPEYEPIE